MPKDATRRQLPLHISAASLRSLSHMLARKLALCRELHGMVSTAPADPPAHYRERFETLTGQSLRACPHCQTGIIAVIGCIPRPTGCEPGPDTS